MNKFGSIFLIFCIKFFSDIINESAAKSEFELSPKEISNNFVPTEKVGEGGFGFIHIGYFKNGTNAARKTVHKDLRGEALHAEIAAFCDLSRDISERSVNLLDYHIPNILGHGVDLDRNTVMFLDPLGGNLMSLKGEGYSYDFICCIAQDLLIALQYMHSKNYLHRDLKPENAAFGVKSASSGSSRVSLKSRVYLLDLGEAGKFSSKTNTQRGKGRRHGSVEFMSRDTSNEFIQSRRDDMESLFYLLWDVAARSLPWKKPYSKMSRESILQAVLDQKIQFWNGDERNQIEMMRSSGVPKGPTLDAIWCYFRVLSKMFLYGRGNDEGWNDAPKYVRYERCFSNASGREHLFSSSEIANDFKSTKIISRASFGAIDFGRFKAGLFKDKKAVGKMETKDRPRKTLHDEIENYRYLSRDGTVNLVGYCIPNMLGFGFDARGNEIMFWDLPVEDIDLRLMDRDFFSYGSICSIALDLLTAIQFLHSQNYLYQNMRPGKFLVGLENASSGSSLVLHAYLLDLSGLIKFEISDGPNTKRKQATNFGTLEYMSIDMMDGWEQNPRDDMESLGYNIWAFAVRYLPWDRKYYPKLDDKSLERETREEKRKFCSGNSNDKIKMMESSGLTDEPMQDAILCYFRELSKMFKLDRGKDVSWMDRPDYDAYRRCFEQKKVKENKKPDRKAKEPETGDRHKTTPQRSGDDKGKKSSSKPSKSEGTSKAHPSKSSAVKGKKK